MASNIMDEPKFDVVIFDRATKEILSIPFADLPLNHTRLPSAASRYQDTERQIANYPHRDIDVVPAGTFKKGDLYR